MVLNRADQLVIKWDLKGKDRSEYRNAWRGEHCCNKRNTNLPARDLR